MPLYVYKKAGYEPPVEPTPLPQPPVLSRKPVFNFHPLPFFISILGLLLIGFVVWPVLSYEIADTQVKPHRSPSGLLAPASLDLNSSIVVQAATPQVVGNLDYTKASNWFPGSSSHPNLTKSDTHKSFYYLSIPKLNIDRALVRTDTEDLSSSLIQYPETAFPGELGSPVIFGHSILPQFYNPKNYISIFSLLPTLENGDEIHLDYDGIIYTYTVSDKTEVYPDNLSVLEQQYDSKRLKIITCVPPGLKIRRLVVTADLVKS